MTLLLCTVANPLHYSMVMDSLAVKPKATDWSRMASH